LEAAVAWVAIIIAGIFEVIWAATMKQSEGFTRLGPSFVTIAALLISFALLAFAMRTLPLGTAYAAWTGIGALGAFAVGIIWLGEPLTIVRAIAALLIVTGVILLKSASSG
jgi:quaternary ammonium compound-resistance protein SugE